MSAESDELVKMEMFRLECCVRGYHVYKDNWEAAVGEELYCRCEQGNPVELYAVSILTEEEIVSHLLYLKRFHAYAHTRCNCQKLVVHIIHCEKICHT